MKNSPTHPAKPRRRPQSVRIMRYVLSFLSSLLIVSVTAQTGPGGVGTSATNLLWLSADQGVTAPTLAVSQWADRSGNANHANQSTSNRQPIYLTNSINGYPAIQFDNDQTTPDFLQVNDNSTLEGMSGLTAFAVFNLNAGTAISAPRCVFGKRNGVDVQQAYNWFFWNSGANLAQHLDIDGTGNRASSSDNLATGVTYLGGFTYHGATPSNAQDQVLFNAGTATGNAAETSTSIPNYSSNLLLGVLQGHTGSGANTSRFNGRMSEVILYNTVLNSVQQTLVNNYLAAKYGTTLSTNDLYTQDLPANGNFDHDVAGIGRRTSTDLHTDSRGSGIVRINNASGLGDDEYLLWGHNNAAMGSWGVSDYPPALQGRLARVWRVSEVNASNVAVNVGSVDITFDLTGLSPVNVADLRLLVDTDNDGLFADETAIGGATNPSGNNFRFTGISALVNGRRFTLGTVNRESTPLPIELIAFTARNEEQVVGLEWTTATERNNALFEVERSTDLLAWTVVAARPGAGDSESLLSYAAEDVEPLNGTSYYRLRQIDTDGASTRSDVVALTRTNEVNVAVLPVPFEDQLMVQVPEGKLLSIDLFNASGQRLMIEQQHGPAAHRLNTAALPAGAYVILVNTAQGAFRRTIIKGN